MAINSNTRGNKVTKTNGTAVLDALAPTTNDAAQTIELLTPYVARITVEGTCAILFHRWSCEDVAAKSAAAKGSRGKKFDNPEAYVYRTEDGEIAIPGEYFRQSIIWAAKFRQDPRSPRKSAMDLFKAGIAVLDEMCSLGVKQWDYLDQRRVTVQRAGITRVRPAMHKGWRCEVSLQVLLPEYIEPMLLNEIAQSAGRIVGVADNRPSYGRFAVVGFDVS